MHPTFSSHTRSKITGQTLERPLTSELARNVKIFYLFEIATAVPFSRLLHMISSIFQIKYLDRCSSEMPIDVQIASISDGRNLLEKY